MKRHYQAIYTDKAQAYDTLVSREDAAGALWLALARLFEGTKGPKVVEMGAGTGRLTRWLCTQTSDIWAFDTASAMLNIAKAALPKAKFMVADSRAIPLPDSVADVCIEGWSLGHLVGDGVEKAVAEMARLTRPGGLQIIIETLGTGVETPQPSDHLAAFYAWLEAECGFTRIELRTDYHFESTAEADSLLRFFFGDQMADKFAGERVIPECTGLWHR